MKNDGTTQKKKRLRSRMSAGSTDDSAVLPRSTKRQKVQQGATATPTVAVNTNPPAPMRREVRVERPMDPFEIVSDGTMSPFSDEEDEA